MKYDNKNSRNFLQISFTRTYRLFLYPVQPKSLGKIVFFFCPSSSIRGFDQKVFVTQIQTALRNLRIKNPGTEYECFSKGKRKQLEFKNIKKKEIKSMVAFSEFDTLKYL